MPDSYSLALSKVAGNGGSMRRGGPTESIRARERISDLLVEMSRWSRIRSSIQSGNEMDTGLRHYD